jgi:hypothetical protein
MSDDHLNWIGNHHEGFGVLQLEDDALHTTGNPPGPSVTETYYFGFHVVEPAIHGYIYAWFHPNLNVVTAGVLISRGHQSCSLAADYFNFQAYLKSDEHVEKDSGVLRLPGDLVFRPIKAMQEWNLQLHDKAADTSFDLHFTAAMPPAVRADQKHFDQNMHVEGALTLRGTRYAVDCFEIRDR